MAREPARPPMKTMQEIRQSNADILRPCDVASVLHCTPYAINIMVREGKNTFPAVMIGTRVKIPRPAFIAWFDGGGNLAC